jgi:hypothetical protein
VPTFAASLAVAPNLQAGIFAALVVGLAGQWLGGCRIAAAQNGIAPLRAH